MLTILPNDQSSSANIYPNPASSQNTFLVSYAMDTPSDATFELLNTLERTVQTVRHGYTDKGMFTLSFHSQNLRSGLYHVLIKQGGIQTLSVPFLVMHGHQYNRKKSG